MGRWLFYTCPTKFMYWNISGSRYVACSPCTLTNITICNYIYYCIVALPSTVSTVTLPSTVSTVALPSTVSPVTLPSTVSTVALPSTVSTVALPSTVSAVTLPSTVSTVALPSNQVFGIPKARQAIKKVVDKCFNTKLLHIIRELKEVPLNTKLGKPKSANSLEWMGEFKMLSWVIEERVIILKAITDARAKGAFSKEFMQYIQLRSTWVTFKVLQTAQMPFYENKLYLCRMCYISLSFYTI